MTQEEIRPHVEFIREESDPDVMPIQGAPVNLTLGLTLIKIREVDAIKGEIEIIGWRVHKWRNPRLAWHRQPSISDAPYLSMNIKDLWTPDLASTNAVHAPEILSPPRAMVYPDGNVTYTSSERLRFFCGLEGFETDRGANCTAAYTSWTNDGRMLNLKLMNNPVMLGGYMPDPRFQLLGTSAHVDTMIYDCCPEPIQNVRFILNIRKKPASDSFFGWKK